MKTQTAVSEKLIASNPVKAALQLCRQPGGKDLSLAEIEEADEALKQLDQIIVALLPVEREMLSSINAKRCEIKNKMNQRRYPAFSLEPLGWYDEDGCPRLAVYSLESPLFELKLLCCRGRDNIQPDSVQVFPNISKELDELYECPSVRNFIDKNGEYVSAYSDPSIVGWGDIRISTNFTALIPQSVKEKIIQVKNDFKQIFIVAEISLAERTKMKANPRKNNDLRKNNDPLVVGYDGIGYWLIAAFDTTSLEEYIKSEFCVKAEPPKEAK